jgi:hypothetical protein
MTPSFCPKQERCNKKEIARLLNVDFIKEVYRPDWLANPILVPKNNKDWRMCVDYTDLNKACNKEHVFLELYLYGAIG